MRDMDGYEQTGRIVENKLHYNPVNDKLCEKNIGEIERAVSELADMIARCDSTADKFENRLSAVLSGAPPVDTEGKVQTSAYQTTLARALDELYRKVRLLNYDLERMLERIEL